MAREGMLKAGEPVWVAVSGGVDSMVLMHVLAELGHPCHVAHVDHGLRGAESTADRSFVEHEAKRLGLEFRAVQVDVEGAKEGRSVQMAARELRYAWFKELLREGPSVMAMAHHRDDVLETLLMGLLRGMGAQGWGGIPPVTTLETGRIIRPLLDVGREQIMANALANGIAFREDASNKDPKYLRNRVRAELLPLMEELRPGARQAMGRATGALRELKALAHRQLLLEADGLVPDGQGVLRIPVARLGESTAPHLLLTHLLREGDPHPDQVEQILEAVGAGVTGARFMLGDRRLTLEHDTLVVDRQPDGFPTFTISKAEAQAGERGGFSWRLCAPEVVDLGLGMTTAWLDRSRLAFPLLLRPWQPGDRLQPVGMQGSKLVSDILTDARVPRNEKEKTYVLLSGEEVVWVVGHRVARGFPPSVDTQEVLRVTWRPT